MSARAILDCEAQTVRGSIRVAKLAEAWDCDHSQIRRLIDSGELEAHGIGKHGLRVYLDSAAAYQRNKKRAPKEQAKTGKPAPHARRPGPVDNAAHKAAMRELRNAGIV